MPFYSALFRSIPEQFFLRLGSCGFVKRLDALFLISSKPDFILHLSSMEEEEEEEKKKIEVEKKKKQGKTRRAFR